jgi:C-1 hydroxylase
MNREDIVALFERRTEAWRRHDAAALAADHAETSVAESPLQGRLEGRKRIEEGYEYWTKSFPDLTFTFRDLVVDGDRVVQFFNIRGTQSAPFGGIPATGRRIDFNGVCLFTLGPDGLFVREQRLYDVSGVLMQLGVLKMKDARDIPAAAAAL